MESLGEVKVTGVLDELVLLKERVGALMHELDNVRQTLSTLLVCADPDARFQLV